MLKMLVTRILTTIPLLIVLSIIVFLMVEAMPGSAAEVILQDGATPEAVADLEEARGFDDPLFQQYGRWLSGALRGDLGESWLFNSSVTELYLDKLPRTLVIGFGGLLIGTALGVGLGVAAGLRPGSFADRASTILASAAVAVPAFWFAMMLAIYFGGISSIFGLRLDWFPVSGYVPLFGEDGINLTGWLHSIALPSVALGIPSSALIARQMRSSMAQVLQTPYIRAQRAMGLSRWQILTRHALKNAMIPVMTAIGFRLAVVIGSAFVVEQVFTLQGAGTTLINAVNNQDMPVVQGGVMLIAILIVSFNLLIDLSYAWLNPKVRIDS